MLSLSHNSVKTIQANIKSGTHAHTHPDANAYEMCDAMRKHIEPTDRPSERLNEWTIRASKRARANECTNEPANELVNMREPNTD